MEPVASLLADLHPNGGWDTTAQLWQRYAGPGWRLVAAVQWGADPADPRINAAAERIFARAPGEGGFAHSPGGAPQAWLTARVLAALAELGWCGHGRFKEALAWLDEAAPASTEGGWALAGRQQTGSECAVTAVGVLSTVAACEPDNRPALRERALAALRRALAAKTAAADRLGHPCLGRTDTAEILWALARAGAPLGPEMIAPLTALQRRQDAAARWRRSVRVPPSLAVPETPAADSHSGWLTLKAVVALLHYAVEAGLHRLFPEKP